MKKELGYLIKNLNYLNFSGPPEREIGSIQYDSRKCEQGSLFVAISGTQTDGHTFIPQAISRGAKTVVCERFPARTDRYAGITVIIVENSRRALAELSNAFYDEPTRDLKVFGITGTNGKTTVTFLLNEIFEAAGYKSGIIGTTGIYYNRNHYGTTHTTPESLELFKIFARMRQSGVEYVAMEVSSHALSQYRAWGIHFTAAGFTNLTLDHLDYHKDFEDYSRTKKMLFDFLPDNSIALVNGDDDYADFMLSECKAASKAKIGRNSEADIMLKNEKISFSGSEFQLGFKHFNFSKEINLKTKLIGGFNIENAALSAGLAIVSGINQKAVESALQSSQGAPGRMQRIELKAGALAIVDYAHTPDALEKAIAALRQVIVNSGSGGRIFCVFGCGGDRDKSKRPVMGDISARLADFTVITSDNPRSEEPDKIIEQIYRGIGREGKAKSIAITNRNEAIKYAVNNAVAGDIVLVAGKGHEIYQVINSRREYFNDIEEILKADGQTDI